MSQTFFSTPAAFRLWLEHHHDSEHELWVGFHKKSSGRKSITWPEAVDQLLCFGWIDGVRRSINQESYVIRVTPRTPGSIWSAVNVKRATELVNLGLMHEAGLKAFSERDAEKTNRYSFERGRVKLDPSLERLFRANKKAWGFFRLQPPGYRKTILWWIMSAKQERTKEKRLGILIGTSQRQARVDLMRPGKSR
jgi:uncharacterized protein YdeI (YjbR/CyaY-like superfamily)